jgi:hypothetical protein
LSQFQNVFATLLVVSYLLFINSVKPRKIPRSYKEWKSFKTAEENKLKVFKWFLKTFQKSRFDQGNYGQRVKISVSNRDIQKTVQTIYKKKKKTS